MEGIFLSHSDTICWTHLIRRMDAFKASGNGKITDYLSENFDVVVRFNGGVYMFPEEFDYYRPESVKEAMVLLKKHGEIGICLPSFHCEWRVEIFSMRFHEDTLLNQL